MRKSDECAACGEPREIAAHGLCFRCYRREARGLKGVNCPNPHNPGIRREQKRVIRAFSQVMGGLADLAVSQEDIQDILDLLGPYLRLIANYIPIAERVNSERATAFTVHNRAGDGGE